MTNSSDMPSEGTATMEIDVNEYYRVKSAVEGAMTAIMMIDRDLNVTFANESSVELLRGHEDTLRSLYRGFRVEDLIGTNIDIFHARPEHQRRLLGDPRNMPYSTVIEVGPLRFKINVTAIHDGEGEFVGCNLEWSDETEKLKSEDKVQRLESAVNSATTALMLCDDDFNISFLNPAVKNILRPRQETLRELFPGFDVESLEGVCIDGFHKNPAKQRALLRDPTRLPYETEIEVGGLVFGLTATAIYNASGDIVGNALEWRDMTSQKFAERNIEELIGSASAGKLDERLNADDYEGFLRGMAENINGMLDAVVAPVRETIRVAEQLAQGNLTDEMEGEYHGGFAELRDALNSSFGNLRRTVSEISRSAHTVSESSADIASGNVQLQKRTEDQAQSLQETASSIEEMTATISQNADNSKEADKLASGARSTAEKGGEVVSNAVASMAEINSSSKKIADIIGVIDEIAFQTNLLALNAAVEAARAGEQGRGFAVVATEVRNLAQRSAEAAKEIKTLISESVEKVEQGTRLVDESGETLKEIVESVQKVSDIVGEIAAASQEQAAGVEQINKAIANIDEGTQQNASQVEEAAAAAESLNGEAEALTRLVSDFDIGENEEAEAPPPKRRSRSARKARPEPSRPRRRPEPEPTDDDQEWEDF